MAQPARRPSALDQDSPSLDPSAIERAYLREKARRRQRIERRTEARRSRVRFWIVLVALVFLTVFLALTAWREVQQIFGI
jgi:fatty acid desaturase